MTCMGYIYVLATISKYIHIGNQLIGNIDISRRLVSTGVIEIKHDPPGIHKSPEQPHILLLSHHNRNIPKHLLHIRPSLHILIQQ